MRFRAISFKGLGFKVQVSKMEELRVQRVFEGLGISAGFFRLLGLGD